MVIIVITSLACHYESAAWNSVEIISHYVINCLSSKERSANGRKRFRQMKGYTTTDTERVTTGS
jgi:hypothetical protein